MAHSAYTVLQVPDAKLLRALEQTWIAQGRPVDNQLTVVTQEGNAKGIAVRMSDLHSDKAVGILLNSGVILSRTINFAMKSEGGMQITIERNMAQVGQQPAPQSGVDRVVVHLLDNLDVERATSVLAVVRQAFNEYSPVADLRTALGPALADFYAKREEGLARLEGLSQRLIEANEAYRLRVDVELANKSSAIDEQLQKDRHALQVERERHSEDFARRESELAAHQKTLDDRSSTHARRQIRADLKKILEDRSAKFMLSDMTNRKRWPIHLLFIVLTVGATTLLASALWNEFRDSEIGTARTVELALCGLSFIGTIGFYIRWIDVWARQHANEEFKMRRLDLDVDRASWLVEVALEFEKEKGTPLPPALLERLSANLFTDSANLERARHPAEDIATAILGASSGIKLKTAGGELELDRKSMKQLRATAENGS